MIEEVYIKGFNRRYSINSDGEVFSNYKVSRRDNTTLIYKKTKLKAQNYNSVISLTNKNGYRSCFSLMSLLKDNFKLTPPDNQHQYDLKLIKSNSCSLANLIFKIRCNKGEFKYYPQPFYNELGKITHKICCKCGEKRDILKFNLKITKGQIRKTYSNSCKKCYVNSYKSNPANIEKIKLYSKKYRQSFGYKEKAREYAQHDRNKLSNSYVKSTLKLDSIKNVSQSLIELKRNIIKINRKVKQLN